MEQVDKFRTDAVKYFTHDQFAKLEELLASIDPSKKALHGDTAREAFYEDITRPQDGSDEGME